MCGFSIMLFLELQKQSHNAIVFRFYKQNDLFTEVQQVIKVYATFK